MRQTSLLPKEGDARDDGNYRLLYLQSNQNQQILKGFDCMTFRITGFQTLSIVQYSEKIPKSTVFWKLDLTLSTGKGMGNTRFFHQKEVTLIIRTQTGRWAKSDNPIVPSNQSLLFLFFTSQNLLHTSKITVTTAYIRSSQSLLAVAWQWLPIVDVPIPLGFLNFSGGFSSQLVTSHNCNSRLTQPQLYCQSFPLHSPGTDYTEVVSFIISCSNCPRNTVSTKLFPSNGYCHMFTQLLHGSGSTCHNKYLAAFCVFNDHRNFNSVIYDPC